MKEFNYVRYVDDFEFSYNEEVEKTKFYQELNKELNLLNLKIKVEKNQVKSFPFEDDNDADFFFDFFSNNSDKKLKYQTKNIYNFIEKSIFREREGYKGSLILMFKSLSENTKNKKINEEAFTIPMLNKLFNMVLMKPTLAVSYLEFIETLLSDEMINKVKMGINDLREQIQYNVKRYIDLNYSQEMYSILSILYYLNIMDIVENGDLKKVIAYMDDLSSTLAFEMLVSDENNINNELYELLNEKLISSLSWTDEFWFFKYHILFRINKDKRTKIYLRYKEYLYENHNQSNLSKSLFFNSSNQRQIEIPLNLAFQKAKTDTDISKFYEYLISKGVSFIELK